MGDTAYPQRLRQEAVGGSLVRMGLHPAADAGQGVNRGGRVGAQVGGQNCPKEVRGSLLPELNALTCHS